MNPQRKENTGTLGKNKDRKSDRHPEYTGKINVDGRDYWLSAWVKEKDGRKFFSLSVKPVEAKSQVDGPQTTETTDPDGDIPF